MTFMERVSKWFVRRFETMQESQIRRAKRMIQTKSYYL